MAPHGLGGGGGELAVVEGVVAVPGSGCGLGGDRGGGGVEEMLARIGHEHRMLRAENEQLRQELESIRSFLSRKPRSHTPQPPPIPKLPDSWGQEDHRRGHARRSAALGAARQVQEVALPKEPAAVLPGMVQTEAWQTPREPTRARAVLANMTNMRTGILAFDSSNRKTMAHEAAEPLPVVEPDRDRQFEERRLRQLFNMKDVDTLVSVRMLNTALQTRYLDDHISFEQVAVAVSVLNAISEMSPSSPAAPFPAEDNVPLSVLLDFLMVPGLLDSATGIEHRAIAKKVVDGLGIVTVEEVVREVTRCTKVDVAKVFTKEDSLFGRTLNSLVMFAVLVNLCTMGMAIDILPEHIMWLAIEVVCVLIYFSEAIFKMYVHGVKGYLWGEAYIWNLTDVTITLISAGELTVTILAWAAPQMLGGSEEKASSALQIAVLLRVLRVARVLRMAKLVRSPMLSDLANMMTGFIIGIPSLAWVLVLFVFILYMIGLIFRLGFGPDAGTKRIEDCGEPDIWMEYFDEDCPVHYLYGEEFFGTVQKAMFTSFRFMLGDYSTRAGKSIIVAFSAGYGKPFEVVFVAWMIIVIFGLFNIITAIFVDSTISGLKYNDIRRKHAKQYERKYVTGKLSAILERVQYLHLAYTNNFSPGRTTVCLQEPWEKVWNTQRIAFDIDEFVFFMSDETVKELFQDIDIDMANPLGAFDTFDPDGDGRVTVPEMVSAIMRLRGEPEKKDIIAGWVAIKALHDKFDKLTKHVIEGAMANGTRLHSPEIMH